MIFFFEVFYIERFCGKWQLFKADFRSRVFPFDLVALFLTFLVFSFILWHLLSTQIKNHFAFSIGTKMSAQYQIGADDINRCKMCKLNWEQIELTKYKRLKLLPCVQSCFETIEWIAFGLIYIFVSELIHWRWHNVDVDAPSSRPWRSKNLISIPLIEWDTINRSINI